MPKRLAALLVLNAFFVTSYGQKIHRDIKNFDTHVYFNGNQLVTEYNIEMIIYDGLGADQSEVNISSQSKIKDLDASIEDLFGNEVKRLKKKDILITDDYDYDTFHSDEIITHFSLIHNRYPYILKYSYAIENSNYINLVYWHPNNHFDSKISNATLRVTLPNDFKFKTIETAIDTSFNTFDPNTSLTNYYWIVKDPEISDWEYASLPTRHFVPGVEITPENFIYGLKGSTLDWKTYGNWHYQLNSGLDQLSATEKARVHELVDHLNNDRDKIKTLYYYLQDNTRYINVSLEIGGLKPHPAEYVCTNKYGDCKALTNYMRALLLEANIPSNYTVIYTGRNPHQIRTDIPSQQFNHVILSVPQPNDTIWLECTSSSYPFNYIGTSNQNRKVLRISEDNSKLVETPVFKPNDCRDIFSTSVDIQSKQITQIVTKAILKGANFEYFNGFENYIPESKQSDLIDRLHIMKGIDVNDIDVSRIDRDSCYINLSIKATAPHLIEPIGNQIMVKPISKLNLPFEKIEKRTKDVVINLPVARIDTIHYLTEKNIKEVKGFKNMELIGKYGEYKQQMTLKGNELTVIRHFLLFAGNYPLEDYPQFYEFIKQTNQQENKKLLLLLEN